VNDKFVDDVLQTEDEYDVAMAAIIKIVDKFQSDTGEPATVVYLSDDEELQSIMMWVCVQEGWRFKRTTKATYATSED